jgi:tRNA(Ile)-lysidine synthase
MTAPALLRALPFTAPDAPVLVGLSGGLDSTVLLHRLAADPAMRARGLRAIHVDHGLQAASAGWAAACVVTCEALGIDCVVRRVDVVDTGHGPEAAARDARRSAFADALRDGEWLALAHHRDDQAETLLLRLLRGSGVDGLGAMRATVPFARGTLWRPLLPFARAQLHAAATAAGLAWHEDASNLDARFDR